MKKITVIGGGTGTFVVLSGLKDHSLDLSAIVTMMDSGGSTGRLRDQLEVLPPGDLRQCLVALSDAPELWRKLFLYRFEKGDLKGHNFGNIFLSALEKVCDNYDTVVDTASYVLDIKGKVIPITFDKAQLCVKYVNGKVLKGEGIIDENNDETSSIEEAFLEPNVNVNPEALNSILDSDYIIVGPGDLYTSVVPVLIVDGVKRAITESKAKIIYNLNLMTKMGQTTGYSATRFLKDITKYLGRQPDYVVVNNGDIPKNILEWYSSQKEMPVKNDLQDYHFSGYIINADVVNRTELVKNHVDSLTRSILRHDTDKLKKVLLKIIGA